MTTPKPTDQANPARVLEWMRTPNRKPAQLAFTEGPERQAAYWIEIAQGEPVAQLGELGEQKPVAWAFKNEYGITLSEGDCTTLPNGASTPLYTAQEPHPDARKVIEQLLYCVEAWERDCQRDHYWRDRDDAITAGLKWLGENK